MTAKKEHGDGRPLVPREAGGIESAEEGERLSEHGRAREAAPRAADVERELEATRDDARRQWRGSTPDERTMERALDVEPGEEEEQEGKR